MVEPVVAELPASSKSARTFACIFTIVLAIVFFKWMSHYRLEKKTHPWIHDVVVDPLNFSFCSQLQGPGWSIYRIYFLIKLHSAMRLLIKTDGVTFALVVPAGSTMNMKELTKLADAKLAKIIEQQQHGTYYLLVLAL